jgi:heptosyltransferase-2
VPQNQILVIRGGAIGDFILTLPVLAALRRQFPQTRLEILGYPHIAQLAVAGGLADAAHAIEARPLAGFFARGGQLEESLQEYFSRFAIIVSYLYDPDGIFQANVASCTRAQFIPGPHRPGATAERHATEELLQPLERLAIFDADAVPHLTLNEAPGLEAGPSGGLGLHPGSGSERKNWPESRWADLLDELGRDSTQSFLILGGEAEGHRLERLAQRLPAGRVEVLQSKPLVEVASRLQRCSAYLGHDTGITHLAAALGVPTVVLWGPTPAEVWAPRGPRVQMLQSATGLEGIDPTDVLTSVRQARAT